MLFGLLPFSLTTNSTIQPQRKSISTKNERDAPSTEQARKPAPRGVGFVDGDAYRFSGAGDVIKLLGVQMPIGYQIYSEWSFSTFNTTRPLGVSRYF